MHEVNRGGTQSQYWPSVLEDGDAPKHRDLDCDGLEAPPSSGRATKAGPRASMRCQTRRTHVRLAAVVLQLTSYALAPADLLGKSDVVFVAVLPDALQLVVASRGLHRSRPG